MLTAMIAPCVNMNLCGTKFSPLAIPIERAKFQKKFKSELSKPLSPKIVIQAKMRMSEFVKNGIITKIKKSV